MIDIFKPLSDSLKSCLKRKEIRTENAVFRIHCVFTSVLLVTGSIILTATQLIGSPIQCIVDSRDSDSAKAITTFCWVSSTYAMADGFKRELEIGKHVVQPGIWNEFNGKGERIYYTYYQWVCFVLFFQALLCYIPKNLLKLYEGGLVSNLALGLTAFCTQENKEKKQAEIVKYMMKHQQRHMFYAIKFWICELLCLVNVLLQMWLMDHFLHGTFWSYGTRLIHQAHLPQEERMDPMIYVFPRVTKCTFNKYGPSGSIVNIDALCVLPQNIINEKTYIFLWFWFMILVVLLGCLLIYRLAIILTPALRVRLLNARSDALAPDAVAVVSSRLDIGDWWLLYLLAKNINPFVYRDVITELADRLDSKIKPDFVYSDHDYGFKKEALGKM